MRGWPEELATNVGIRLFDTRMVSTDLHVSSACNDQIVKNDRNVRNVQDLRLLLFATIVTSTRNFANNKNASRICASPLWEQLETAPSHRIQIQ